MILGLEEAVMSRPREDKREIPGRETVHIFISPFLREQTIISTGTHRGLRSPIFLQGRKEIETFSSGSFISAQNHSLAGKLQWLFLVEFLCVHSCQLPMNLAPDLFVFSLQAPNNCCKIILLNLRCLHLSIGFQQTLRL